MIPIKAKSFKGLLKPNDRQWAYQEDSYGMPMFKWVQTSQNFAAVVRTMEDYNNLKALQTSPNVVKELSNSDVWSETNATRGVTETTPEMRIFKHQTEQLKIMYHHIFLEYMEWQVQERPPLTKVFCNNMMQLFLGKVCHIELGSRDFLELRKQLLLSIAPTSNFDKDLWKHQVNDLGKVHTSCHHIL